MTPHAELKKASRASRGQSRAPLRVVTPKRNLQPRNVLQPRIVVCDGDVYQTRSESIVTCNFTTASNMLTCTRIHRVLLHRLNTAQALLFCSFRRSLCSAANFCAPTQAIGSEVSQPGAPPNAESQQAHREPRAQFHVPLRVATRIRSLQLKNVLKLRIVVCDGDVY